MLTAFSFDEIDQDFVDVKLFERVSFLTQVSLTSVKFDRFSPSSQLILIYTVNNSCVLN